MQNNEPPIIPNNVLPIVPDAVIPPGVTPTPEPKRFWGFWPTAGLGVVIMVIFFIISVIVAVVMGVVVAFSNTDAVTDPAEVLDALNPYMGLLVSVAGIIAAVAGFFLVIAFIKARHGAGIADYLGLKPFGWKSLLVIVLATAAFLALSTLVFNSFDIEQETGLLNDAYATSVWPALFWISVVVFAPLFEEALFRGFIYEGFRRSPAGAVGAIILTSIGWAILHFYYAPFEMGTIFFLGLVLGFVRYKTNSLWPPILMHAFNNAAATFVLAMT
jgi:hypothetical protein